MPSQLSTVNWALDLIAAKRLSSLEDDTERAEQISAAWDDVRDDALRRFAWKFATTRTIIGSRDLASPAWGFDYQFTLPGDCLRVLQVGEYWVGLDLSDYRQADASPYRIEGEAPGKVLTSLWDADLPIIYTRRVETVGSWDVCFAKYVAGELAERIAPRATENDRTMQRIEMWKRSALSEALRTNSVELPPQPLADSEWIAARYQ